ncbi:MAG: ABC transporter substrate-binding protein [Desulfobacterales bacterium]|jgi:branched-chain amino acid transport system substrate-binding protein|nr:MAG: ABC transporter substrate-binding protein [Desulfobacterales bacterium]
MGKKILLTFLLVALACSSGWAADVVVGSLNDMTGPTSDVGKDNAAAVREAVAYVNDTGGINGKKIDLRLYDYGYKVPEAITIYKRFKTVDKVTMILGWGTGDTEALSPTVAKDKMPYLSDSFSGHICDPKKSPYNFVYGTDYSTNARAALITWYEEVWQKDPKWAKERAKGKPRLACFYSFPHPYASAPIRALKDQAALLGFEMVPDQDVGLAAIDAKSQVLAAKKHKPHLIWHGNTTNSVAVGVKDAYALQLGADHIVNNWGYDENLVKLAGKAAEGVVGIAVCAFYGLDVPMMDKVKAYGAKVNPGIKPESRTIRAVQGWVKVLLAAEAMKRADKAGKLNGPGIKEAFETLSNYDLAGVANALGRPPITYTSTDHRPGSSVGVYIIKNGTFKHLKTVDLKQRHPDLWPKWLGW